MPTKRQETAAQKTLESIGTDKSKGEILRESGFSEAIAKNPKIVMESKGFKEALKPFEDKIEEEINAAIELAGQKRHDASYSDLITAAEKLKKLHRLIQDQSTENVAINIIDSYQIEE